MTGKEALRKGKYLRYDSFKTPEEFRRVIVDCIEVVITEALEEHGTWDNMPEHQAVTIINEAKPLFDRLGAWWREHMVITVQLYAYYCKTYDAGPKVFVDYDCDYQPQYRRRISFM